MLRRKDRCRLRKEAAEERTSSTEPTSEPCRHGPKNGTAPKMLATYWSQVCWRWWWSQNASLPCVHTAASWWADPHIPRPGSGLWWYRNWGGLEWWLPSSGPSRFSDSLKRTHGVSVGGDRHSRLVLSNLQRRTKIMVGNLIQKSLHRVCWC